MLWDTTPYHYLRCEGDGPEDRGCPRVTEPKPTMELALIFAQRQMFWEKLPDGKLVCPACRPELPPRVEPYREGSIMSRWAGD